MYEEGSSGTEDLPPLACSEEEDIGEYYFESDPLALKDNPDYQQLIKALVKLQAQRTRAVKDMERLQEARDEALRDPLGFVTALENGDSLNLPGPQEITPIPHIDWEKYNVKSIMQGMRPKTRKRIHQENLAVQQQVQESRESNSVQGKIMVRGRLYDGSKPQTFNQSWTEEEQRKLEELLIKYPDEPIASHRWVKISKELGTRTPLQVQSRVQKYFIALKRGGLPVPGKNPRTAVVRKQGGRRRGTVLHAVLSGRASSFMKAFNMFEDEDQEPYMFEDEDQEPHMNNTLNFTASNTNGEVSDEDDVVEELQDSEEYRELLKLKQVRSLKVREMETGIISHSGFACDMCGMDPIMGTRWHCVECPVSTSVDLCGKCVKSSFSSDSHRPSHILQPFKAFCIRDAIA